MIIVFIKCMFIQCCVHPTCCATVVIHTVPLLSSTRVCHCCHPHCVHPTCGATVCVHCVHPRCGLSHNLRLCLKLKLPLKQSTFLGPRGGEERPFCFHHDGGVGTPVSGSVCGELLHSDCDEYGFRFRWFPYHCNYKCGTDLGKCWVIYQGVTIMSSKLCGNT